MKLKINIGRDLPKAEPKMHTKPCKHCPSAHYPPDPEALDIMQWSREERIKTAFPCGWNGKRYCKGYCDSMEITNDDLLKLNEEK